MTKYSDVVSPLLGWVLVTATSHPNIFEAFENISHDCGASAGHSNYAVPPEWAVNLAHCGAYHVGSLLRRANKWRRDEARRALADDDLRDALRLSDG